MNILIGADLVPTKSNISSFVKADTDELIGMDLTAILNAASYRIFNLEVPLTDTSCPITKLGPNLIAPVSTVNGYRSLGINLLTLANNHILDQGESGLRSTVDALKNSGIFYVGAGKNLKEAAKPFIFDFAGKKVGVYACAEHEFSIARENSSGANPFDPLWSLDHVEELKKNTDYVVVLYHGGKEHYRYPSPNLQKVCRRLVDKGADLIICQHSHCIGCEEKYKTGTIIYGQGNFLFDDSNSEYWRTSLLVSVDESFYIKYIPLVKQGNGVRLAGTDDSQKILADFVARSEEIKKDGFISESYSKFADDFTEFYLRALSGKKSVLYRLINKLIKGRYMERYLARAYDASAKVKIANYVDCEAHRELLSQGLLNGYVGEMR